MNIRQKQREQLFFTFLTGTKVLQQKSITHAPFNWPLLHRIRATKSEISLPAVSLLSDASLSVCSCHPVLIRKWNKYRFLCLCYAQLSRIYASPSRCSSCPTHTCVVYKKWSIVLCRISANSSWMSCTLSGHVLHSLYTQSNQLYTLRWRASIAESLDWQRLC